MGYIAFQSFRHPLLAVTGRKIVVSNPICAPANYQALTQRFLAQHPKAIFLQIDHDYATVLASMGYQVNCFGIETEIPLAGFNVNGKHRSKLRQWRNKCEREEVVVEHCKISDLDPNEIQSLSNAWLKNRSGREFTLLTRPFQACDEEDVFFLTARQHGKLIGMTSFDPIYDAGKVSAYYHNIDRIASDAPNGTSAFCILEAIKLFALEEIQYVTLGFSPLYDLQEVFPHSRITNFSLRFAYDHLNFLYPFQGNASHKKKFGGDSKPVYVSCTQGNSVRELLSIIKTLKLF
ncbi:phosphatidylglycerol lysyltransferase domain-containing protein [Rosistilla carotiformis]